MSSYWIESTKNIYNPHPSLDKNISTDICIIGGGLAGLTCSYLLSKRGFSTTILEKNTICSHTSRKYYTEKLQALMVYFTNIYLTRMTIILQKNM